MRAMEPIFYDRHRFPAQCFLATHGAVYNVFNYQRHLISCETLRQLQSQADETWALATAAA